MATNPIGANNAILQSCVTKDIRSALGRLAYMHDTTVSKYIAELVRKEVSIARIKGVLTDAGQTTLELGVCAVLCLGIAATSWASITGENGLRRIRRVRSKDEIVCVDQIA